MDLQVEKITTELEQKDQKAQNELNRIEYERERRRVIKEVRTEAHALSAARKKKADDFRKQRVGSCLPVSLSLHSCPPSPPPPSLP
jgi:DNA repair ATPase RecN